MTFPDKNNFLDKADSLLCELADLLSSQNEKLTQRAESAENIAALSESVINGLKVEKLELLQKLQAIEGRYNVLKDKFNSSLNKVEATGQKIEMEAAKLRGTLAEWQKIFAGENPKRAKEKLKSLQTANAKLQQEKETLKANISQLYKTDQNMRDKLKQAGMLSLYNDDEKEISIFLHHTALCIRGASGKATRGAIALQYWQGAAGRLVFLDPNDNHLNIETKNITSIDQDAELFMRGWLEKNFLDEYKKRNKQN